jgi:hypothetical protein
MYRVAHELDFDVVYPHILDLVKRLQERKGFAYTQEEVNLLLLAIKRIPQKP